VGKGTEKARFERWHVIDGGLVLTLVEDKKRRVFEICCFFRKLIMSIVDESIQWSKCYSNEAMRILLRSNSSMRKSLLKKSSYFIPSTVAAAHSDHFYCHRLKNGVYYRLQQINATEMARLYHVGSILTPFWRWQ